LWKKYLANSSDVEYVVEKVSILEGQMNN